MQIAGFVEDVKHRLDVLQKPASGRRLLDVGCGPGDDTRRLAAAVAPDGLVIGLDADLTMVEIARARALASPHSRCVRHVVGDAAALPYTTGFFDGCRCERVLQHVADPVRVIAEMVRVTATGGVIVAADSDWNSLSIHVDDVNLEREVVAAVARRFRTGSAGRQLRDLLRTCGLADVVVEPRCVQWTSYRDFRATSFMAADTHRGLIADGAIDRRDWDRFVGELERVDARGGFFATAVMVIAAAVKG